MTAESEVSGMGLIGREQELQMLVVARQVADFAYKQGVGEALAVDDLVREYEALRNSHRGAVDETRREVVDFLWANGMSVAAAKVAAHYGIETDPSPTRGR